MTVDTSSSSTLAVMIRRFGEVEVKTGTGAFLEKMLDMNMSGGEACFTLRFRSLAQGYES